MRRLFVRSCLRQRRPLKLQTRTLCALLLAAFATGALIPTLGYQMIVASEQKERQLIAARFLEMQADTDEIRVQIVAAHHKLRHCSGNGSVTAPDYSSIDRVIDDPPSDTAARSLYYELAYNLLCNFMDYSMYPIVP